MFRLEKFLFDVMPMTAEQKKSFDKSVNICIDQFDAQDFNKNEAGFIRNDISQLARAQSQSEYDSIMRRLVELRKDGSIDDKTTDEEAFAQIIPRYSQHVSEINQWLEMSNGSVMTKVNDAYDKALKDLKIDKPPVDSSSSSSVSE